MFVVSLDCLVRRHIVGFLAVAFLKLYEADDGIVDDAYELWANAFIDVGDAFRLDAADAVGFDVYLVGERRWAQDAPGCPVVVKLLHEQGAALSHHLLELFLGLH